ncbi:MAG: divalent-cation tolerance protein CutA [Deltaproteobacteria bacterium]|nr:divalent-cation tolerance protein CutA [Deltaproteobacteria bacterium]MBW2069796.1 divalent-cation tolerance protein CutA [Deltaproteobacteria bacterium]
MANHIVVFVTTPAQQAPGIARTLVEERLVACVNITPEIRSIYWWQGEIEDDSEVLCMMKTRQELFAALQRRIKAIHPYEVPEIIALPIVAGSQPYLDWIDQNTAGIRGRQQPGHTS